MKKITSVLCFLLFAAVAVNAQEYRKFRVGVGAGYAMPGGEGAKAGALFYIEPGYRINDQIIANLRMEWAGMARGFSDASAVDGDFDVSFSGSYTLNGQYYFSNEGFRPFVGVGFGMFSITAATIDDTDLGLDNETKFGFYPRVGFDAGHFTLSIDYNIVGNTTVEGVDGNFKNSYLGIRFGGFFGGGRK